MAAASEAGGSMPDKFKEQHGRAWLCRGKNGVLDQGGSGGSSEMHVLVCACSFACAMEMWRKGRSASRYTPRAGREAVSSDES